MYAVINTGGKQYRLSEGDIINIEKLAGNVGDEVVFDNVLMVAGDEDAMVGTPAVEGARVVGTILEQGRGEKITVFKFKRRKMYRRKQGHRQALTTVRIESVEAEAKKAASKKDVEGPKKTAAKPKAKTASKEKKVKASQDSKVASPKAAAKKTASKKKQEETEK